MSLNLLKKARAGIRYTDEMLGAMSLYLDPVEAPDVTDTMATDGDSLFFNPGYLAAMKPAHATTMIAHETVHCMLGHPARLAGREPRLANIAADHVVNIRLKDAGFELWPGALCDDAYRGMSFEEVYMRLGGKRSAQQPEPQQQPGDQQQDEQQQDDGPQQGKPNDDQQPGDDQQEGQGQDEAQQPAQGGQQGQDDTAGPSEPGQGQEAPQQPEAGPQQGKEGQADAQPGQVMPAKGKSQAERAQNEEQWRERTMQEAQFAQMAGTLSGDMAQLVETLKHPQVSWEVVLQRFMTDPVTSDYSWRRPSRRFIGQGLYLPSLRSEGLGTVVLMVDTSGSTLRYRETFAAEFNAVRELAKPARLIVLYVDTRVCKVEEYGPDDPMGPLNCYGNGGTDFRPGFEYLEAEQIDPACIIYLTDLECHSYPVPPAAPVLWVSAKPGTAPFGEVVQLHG